MNPFDLSASDLLIWGLVLHLVADWPLQNDWMANNKAWPWKWSISGLLPAFTHAGVHALLLGIVFGFWPGVVLGVVHLLIDTRKPIVWWSKFIGQTQPTGVVSVDVFDDYKTTPIVDIGLEVRFWTDQVFHIVTVAIAALVVNL